MMMAVAVATSVISLLGDQLVSASTAKNEVVCDLGRHPYSIPSGVDATAVIR
jgi:hypothetical protein